MRKDQGLGRGMGVALVGRVVYGEGGRGGGLSWGFKGRAGQQEEGQGTRLWAERETKGRQTDQGAGSGAERMGWGEEEGQVVRGRQGQLGKARQQTKINREERVYEFLNDGILTDDI
jgi:hypothetical protein